jgi:hypothetical protein
MQQWYQCPQCGAPVAFGVRFCGSCGLQLNWQTQQTQPPPVYQQFQQPRKESKKTSPSLIGCLAFIVIAFLIGGAIFAFREPSSTTPTPPEFIQQYENRQPLVLGSHNNTAHLSNNPDASDVSFAELKTFILDDATSEKPYKEGVADCVDFAEQVHNNAERAGIEAAFVCCNFVGEETGHALNAFKTTDRGLVYIDCTGQRLKFKTLIIPTEVLAFMGTEGESKEVVLPDKPSPGQYDKVAYIEKDKQFGCISIEKAASLDYSFYIGYTQDWQKLDGMIDEFNNEVDAFNQALGGRTALAEPEYSQFKAWEAKIEDKKQMILELADELGDGWFEPLGIVETVEIYW